MDSRLMRLAIALMACLSLHAEDWSVSILNEVSGFVIERRIIHALNMQIREHLQPAYGVSATVVIGPSAARRNRIDVHVRSFCGPNTPGLHYAGPGFGAHEPKGEACVTAFERPESFALVLSHEVLEALLNPLNNTFKRVTLPNGTGALLGYEICDAVKDSVIWIEGIPLTDFVLPAWWVWGTVGPWDAAGVLAGPLLTAPGGYMPVVR